MKSLQEMAASAEPGAWKDALDAFIEGTAAHEQVCADNSEAYNRYYDVPEHARDALAGHLAPAVAAMESSAIALRALRDRLPSARDDAFAEKAARLGADPAVDGEPVWIRLMRDLQTLREWRYAHLDGIDVQLAQFVMREPSRKEPGMFDRALQGWSKAAGLKVGNVRAEVLEIAQAGLLPGIVSDPATYTYEVPGDHTVALADLVERRGVDEILAHVRLAGEVLPAEAFPVPEEAIRNLEGAASPRP